MVDISVIIVSYNVKLFLEQTINAVLGSTGDFSLEIIVVDNNSTDGSVEYIGSNISHPITFIINKENVGFAKANNQGLEKATGKYALLLNPDTVVQADTLVSCLEFAKSNKNIGALGVRMVDGGGAFLPESKRSLPKPLNSFWKLSGIANLFPKSRVFNAYNLSHIAERADAEIDVLCGAFMFMPIKIVREVGMLDEDYFMYGEDIDLSYKIKKAGHQIWYLGTHSIIHYKGQSTQKSSLAYINTFYNAMSIFAKKHYNSSVLTLSMLSVAIALRQFTSVLRRILKSILPLLLDGMIFIVGILMIKSMWAKYQFNDPEYYDSTLITLNIIIYVIIWLLTLWITRSYALYTKLKVYIPSIFIGLLIILTGYSLLPESLRTSRAIILLSALWVLFSGSLVRLIYSQINTNDVPEKRIGIVGFLDEVERARSIVQQALGSETFTYQLDPNKFSVDYLIAQKEFYQLNEIVFCLKDITLDKALSIMSKKITGINYKLIGDKSLNIIGSNKSNLLGEVYGLDIEYRLADNLNLYYKRLIDILGGSLLILCFPLLILSSKFRQSFTIKKLIMVLTGQLALVGYCKSDIQLGSLPPIKDCCIEISNRTIPQKDHHEINTSYALHYTPWRDIVILFDSLF